MGAEPRLVAWELLEGAATGRVARIAEELDARHDLAERDRALAAELALGVSRWQRLYDHLADRFLRRDSQPLALRLALRLAAHQLFALDRIPPHAAGSSSVELLKRTGNARLTGVANAVIRRLAALRLEERREGLPGPHGRVAERELPLEPGLRYSLPDLLVDDLRPVLPEEGEAALRWLNHVPPLCTRTRRGRAVDDHPDILRRDGPWTWWRAHEAALAAVAAGICVVQDRGQGCLLEWAAVSSGARVADCCAAPGGKSAFFHDAGCRVVSGDVAPAKVPLLRAALGRDAPILVQDAAAPALAPAFDLVVVDAPCSNSAVLARRPEARWRYDRRHLAELERLQGAILRGASGIAADHGRLLYSTCSLSPRENVERARALAGWRVERELTVWPDAWQMGGYAAILARG